MRSIVFVTSLFAGSGLFVGCGCNLPGNYAYHTSQQPVATQFKKFLTSRDSVLSSDVWIKSFAFSFKNQEYLRLSEISGACWPDRVVFDSAGDFTLIRGEGCAPLSEQRSRTEEIESRSTRNLLLIDGIVYYRTSMANIIASSPQERLFCVSSNTPGVTVVISGVDRVDWIDFEIGDQRSRYPISQLIHEEVSEQKGTYQYEYCGQQRSYPLYEDRLVRQAVESDFASDSSNSPRVMIEFDIAVDGRVAKMSIDQMGFHSMQIDLLCELTTSSSSSNTSHYSYVDGEPVSYR